ncbi:hypothetical protein [Azotobacter salinestris]|uniref:hypothetical protein n=1 Tax=Azotobacter salinestris TaxID=69964 RepID=UPI0032DF5EE1
MTNFQRRQMAAQAPAYLENAVAWLHLHLLVIELLPLTVVAGLLAMEVLPWTA